MKTETVALIVAVLGVAVAIYAATRKPSSVTYVQAQKRNEAEAILSGIGALAEGIGGGIGAVWQPRIGIGGSSSSRG